MSSRRYRAPLSLMAIVLFVASCGTEVAEPAASDDEPPSASASPSAAPRTTEPSTAPSLEPTPAPSSPIGSFPELSEAPLDPDAVSRLDAVLAADVELGELESISAAVIVPGIGAWTAAGGTGPDGLPLPANAQFAVASVTKTVVAAQMLRLVEDGRIGLDDPIADHLAPELAARANGATVRQLLSMESGLAQPPQYIEPDLIEEPTHSHAVEDWIRLLDEPEEEPGSSFMYNNVNFALLGAAIEEVTGQTLAETLRAGVLAGDGLDRLIYQDAERPEGPVAAPGVLEDLPSGAHALEVGGGFLPSRAIATEAGAAGGMASDALTLARWGYRLYGGFLLEPETLSQVVDVADGYGLGCHPVTEFGLRGIGHQGESAGYRSLLYADRATGTIVVVLVNSNQWSPGITAANLLRAVLTD